MSSTSFIIRKCGTGTCQHKHSTGAGFIIKKNGTRASSSHQVDRNWRRRHETSHNKQTTRKNGGPVFSLSPKKMETKYDIGTTKRETIKEKKGKKIDKLSYPAPGQSRFLTQQTSYSVVIASGGGQHPLFGTRLHLSSSPNRPRDGEYGQQKHNSQIVINKKKETTTSKSCSSTITIWLTVPTDEVSSSSPTWKRITINRRNSAETKNIDKPSTCFRDARCLIRSSAADPLQRPSCWISASALSRWSSSLRWHRRSTNTKKPCSTVNIRHDLVFDSITIQCLLTIWFSLSSPRWAFKRRGGTAGGVPPVRSWTRWDEDVKSWMETERSGICGKR